MIYQQLLNKISKSMLGNGVKESIITANGKITLKDYRKHRAKLKSFAKEFKRSKTLLEDLHGTCINHLHPVTEPLALISQIQRSGGSLLSQLFDGHPQLHAHPHEMKIGYPDKYTWPRIDLDDHPKFWLEMLFESNVINHFKVGYKKQRNMDDTHLFLFLPSLQNQLFLNYLNSIEEISQRDVFDAYMTSYFGAWLNNQNIFSQKKYITAFTARLSMNKENMDSFFEIYPDGRLITIIRDPKNWYPSAAKHKPLIYGDINKSLNLWQASARAMLRNRQKYNDRVCIITFEDLIGKTESVLHYLAKFLRIKYDDILLTPTFNKIPIKANTSFKAKRHGIINSTLNRYKSLSQQELDTIEKMTKELHRKVLSQAMRF